MLTTKQAAKILGYDESHVRRIAKVLGGEKRGRDWFFDNEKIKNYSKPKMGAKKDKKRG